MEALLSVSIGEDGLSRRTQWRQGLVSSPSSRDKLAELAQASLPENEFATTNVSAQPTFSSSLRFVSGSLRPPISRPENFKGTSFPSVESLSIEIANVEDLPLASLHLTTLISIQPALRPDWIKSSALVPKQLRASVFDLLCNLATSSF